MRIGELARKTGTTPKAVRLYEARGLLGTVARAGTYRQYGEEDVARVLLIRQAQALGFRLAELAGMPGPRSADGWEPWAQLLAARRAHVAQELQRLQHTDRQLAQFQAELTACAGAAAPATPEDCLAAQPPADTVAFAPHRRRA